ncbi:MAG TPA: hypothetical protein DGF30_03910 [Desulfomicrobium sp.]|nr:hypothetical protein [Desulfomicrobium sp.]
MHIYATLKIIRGILILLSLPGILVTLYAGAAVVRLLKDEFFPDPANIAHGMAMAHAFIPMIVWTILGILYLCLIWALLVVVKRVGRRQKQQIRFP